MQILRLALGGLLAMAVLLALSVEHGPDRTNAATFDVPCDSFDLLWAVYDANDETNNPGADTLELAAGCSYSFTEPWITGNVALPPITSTITINGHGATISRDPSAAARFRIFSVASPGIVTLNETTISGGRAPNGSGAGQPGQSGGGIVLFSGSLTIVDSTITGNQAGDGSANGLSGGNGGLGGSGGGIYAAGGSLSIVDTTISANSAGNGGAGRSGAPPTGGFGGTGGSGGGILAATLTIVNSTVSGNTAGAGGPGGAGGGNGGNGGGIVFAAGSTKTLTNVTVAANNAGSTTGGTPGSGGGIYLGTGGVSKNSIIANNAAGGNCGGPFGFQAGSINNIASDASCVATASGSINLGSLANNGGPTLTHALLGGSAAIDAGDNGTCAAAPVNNLDQRGITRPTDGDTTAGAVCDIGSYEAPALQLGPQFTVDSTAADNDGACHLPPGDCSLREAINAANADGQPSEVQLGDALTYTLTGEDNPGNGLPIISTDIVIMGNGSTIARDPGAPLFRIFQVPSGGTLLLDHVTVSGGEATGATGDGGGIYANGGQLNVFFSTISGNRAAMGTTGIIGGPGRHGGGIAISNGGSAFFAMSTINANLAGTGGAGTELNSGDGGNGGGIALLGGTLFIDRSLISVNFAGTGRFSSTGSGGGGGWGGGLYLAGGSSVEIRNTTIYSNSAGVGAVGSTGSGNGGNGGGIAAPSAITTLTNLTFSNNNVGTAGGAGAVNGTGSGIYGDANAITARNMIMANGTGGNCGTGSAPAGFGSANNIATDATCGTSFTQKTLGQINFGTFGNHGGPTLTLPLLPGSHAIDTGSQSICDSLFIDLDQRGVIRPYDGDSSGTATCDIGAFEYCPDTDLDLRCAGFDNCPNWYNPQQNLPDWVVPAGDSDCDNFTDAAEVYSGTEPAMHCASTSARNDESGPDRWPSDFDDNQLVNIIDVSTFSSHYGSNGPNAPYDKRWDFNGDNRVNIIDVSKMSQTYGKNCSG